MAPQGPHDDEMPTTVQLMKMLAVLPILCFSIALNWFNKKIDDAADWLMEWAKK
jgi:hypothetical protein